MEKGFNQMQEGWAFKRLVDIKDSSMHRNVLLRWLHWAGITHLCVSENIRNIREQGNKNLPVGTTCD